MRLDPIFGWPGTVIGVCRLTVTERVSAKVGQDLTEVDGRGQPGGMKQWLVMIGVMGLIRYN